MADDDDDDDDDDDLRASSGPWFTRPMTLSAIRAGSAGWSWGARGNEGACCGPTADTNGDAADAGLEATTEATTSWGRVNDDDDDDEDDDDGAAANDGDDGDDGDDGLKATTGAFFGEGALFGVNDGGGGDDANDGALPPFWSGPQSRPASAASKVPDADPAAPWDEATERAAAAAAAVPVGDGRDGPDESTMEND